MGELFNILLVIGLILLILLSAFFSGSETGMMSLNRYRLAHLVRRKQKKAIRINRLLERPDRLLGVILISNTFANILAAAIATLLAVHFFGEIGVVISTVLLTIVILIFAEVTPKTLAALYPQNVASFVSGPLKVLLYVLSPLVWLVNSISNGLLKAFRIKIDVRQSESISREELRSIVYETSNLVSSKHKSMLLGILDLENVVVEDIMVPRQEIIGLDLNDNLDDIVEQIKTSQYTRLPIYEGDINQIKGMIHLRDIAKCLTSGELTKQQLVSISKPCYFVPESASLHRQLLNFQQHKRRICLVVDEYGDVQGLATLEDILEEIVGEFTTDIAATSRDIHPQTDGSVLVDGSVTIRELNRLTGWSLPTEGPKTLSGLVIEYLEFIPSSGTSVLINHYPIEIMQVKENTVKTVKVLPKLTSEA